MGTMKRIFKRTEAGRKAWDTQNPDVPLEYRRILGLIKTEMHVDSIRASVGRYSEAELLELLAELEGRGLVESVQGAAEHDLDFTGEFNVSALLGRKS